VAIIASPGYRCAVRANDAAGGGFILPAAERPTGFESLDDNRAGLPDGREIWIEVERVADVTVHPP
jgi:hypothetical protein